MNILFVLYDLPHLSKSSMYSDLVNEFKRNGHNVFPMAPMLMNYKQSDIFNENDIEVLRVKTMNVFDNGIIKRGLANILLPLKFKKAYCSFWSNISIDLIIVATPSVMFAGFISFVKNKNKSKVYLLQKDIFPQNAVDLGFFKKNSLLYKFFKINEIKLLNTADVVGCTSLGNIKYFLTNYSFPNNKKFKLLYNSTKLFLTKTHLPLSILDDDLINKFIVVFGGNLGKPQQFENVLLLAKNATVINDVLFLILGKGTEIDRMKEIVKALEITNIKFINEISRENYFNLLCNCDLGLISLHQNFSVPNTPMKLNDYLNASLPILASINRKNDLGELLVNNKIGRYAFADSPDLLFEHFLELYQDKELRIEMGKNGYDFCLKNLSVEKSYKDILYQLDDIY
jgi:glycosyltransferase involved in cell wall biosynthesis